MLSIFTLVLLLSIPALTTSLSFNMSSITYSDSSRFNVTGDAYISDLGIQVTPDDAGAGLIQAAGRATYTELLHLWDRDSRNITNFSTHFSFLIDSNGSAEPHYGDGLAFFFAPLGSSIKSWSYGGSLGLGNSNTPVDSSSLEAFVAVEFDTFRNTDYDPAYSPHVGIDVNSMRSVVTASWENNISYGAVNDVWISYTASSKTLRVDFTGHVSNGARQGSLVAEVDLRDFLPEYVTVEFSAATGSSFEKHNVKSWDFSSSLEFDDPNNNNNNNKNHNNKKILIIVVGLCVGLTIVLSIVVWIIKHRALRVNPPPPLPLPPPLSLDVIKSGVPRSFSYEELVDATNNFAEKLGHGGFGEVYKGRLRETNELVAVKKVWSGSRRGRKEYESEVKIVSQVRDMNLVQLRGWCHQTRELLLVYEFMPNGSLDSHLFDQTASPLSWERRFKIAEGVAAALFYLHERLNPYVLHRDVKSSNIMLDSNFEARLGDFGMARLVDRGKDFKTTQLAGTPGYVDPEHWIDGEKANKANDVYSFGIVLLEIACGGRAVDGDVVLVARVRELQRDGQLLDAADPKVQMSESDQRKVLQMLVVGLMCAHRDSSQRPTIGQAIKYLESELSSSDNEDLYSTAPSRMFV